MTFTDNMPESVRQYRDAMDAWNLAAARWLGLDPEAVTRLDVDTSERGHTVAKWEAVERQRPPLGYVETGVASDGECVVWSGSLTLDYPDATAFSEALGPKPEMFTPAERERLARLE